MNDRNQLVRLSRCLQLIKQMGADGQNFRIQLAQKKVSRVKTLAVAKFIKDHGSPIVGAKVEANAHLAEDFLVGSSLDRPGVTALRRGNEPSAPEH